MSSVSDDKDEITEADGPLIRAALDRAREIDEAPAAEQRRKGWPRMLGTAAVAFAERFLRDTFVWGAVLFSIVAILVGVTSGSAAWAVPMAAAGVAGIVLVFWALARRWTFGRQWAVLLGVLLAQIVLVLVQWRIG